MPDRSLSAIALLLCGLLLMVTSVANAQFIMLQNGPNQSSPGSEGWVRHADNTRQWVDSTCRDRLQRAGIPVKVVNYSVIGGYPETNNWLRCDDIEDIVKKQNGGAANDAFVMMQNGKDQPSPGNEGWVRHPDNTRQWVDASCRARLEDAGMPVIVVRYAVIGGYPSTGNWMLCDELVKAIRSGNDDDGKDDRGGNDGGGNDAYDGLVMLQNGRSQASPGSQGWVRYLNETRQWVNPDCRETLEAAGMPTRVVNYAYISRLPKTTDWKTCLELRLALDGGSSGGASSSSSGGASSSSSGGASSSSSGGDSGSSSGGASSSSSGGDSSSSSGGDSSSSSGGDSSSSSGGGGAVQANLLVRLDRVPEAPAFVAGEDQASASKSEITVDPRGTSNNHHDAEGAFRIQCKITEDAYQDPIVKFGQDNAAHHHLFFGNARIDEFATNDPKVTSSQNIQRQPLYRYSCHGGRANQSGYWTPVVYDQNGEPRMPQGMVGIYYKTVSGKSGANLKSFPQGLQMVAGSAGAMAPQSNWGLRIGCRGSGYFPTIQPTQFQYCDPSSQMVEMFIRFPNCWNGVDLTDVDNDGDPRNDNSDAADDPHSHMRYSNGSSCPASHPVPLPIVSYNFRYELKPGDDSSRWYLSSDLDMATGKRNRPGGSSWHADWINGWDPAVMEEWMNGCVRPNRHCANGDMGRRRLASPPPSRRTKHISEYDADKDAFYRFNRPVNSSRDGWRATIDACGSKGKAPLSFDFSAELNCETPDGRNKTVRLGNAQLAAHGLNSSSCGAQQLDLLSLGNSVGYQTTNGKTPCSIGSITVKVIDDDGASNSAVWTR